MADTSAGSGIDSTLGSLLTSGIGAASTIYGSQNAAEAQNTGILNGIGQQNTTLGNINSIYGNQSSTGNAAISQLNGALGLDGKSIDPSILSSMPGYQFAVNQGTQAINRQASAQGGLYTPNTTAAVGQYVTGTASQNYNNYISQLLQTAGLGSSANAAQASAQTNAGNNISQLDQNSGNAEASGINGAASGLNSILGQNASGIASLIGSGIKGIGNLFGGSSSSSSLPDLNYDWNSMNSQYGDPTLDNTVGNVDLSGIGTPNFDFGDTSNP